MNNRYIIEYEHERQRGVSYVDAINKALTELEHDREAWGYKKNKKGIGWRGWFQGLFYDTDVTKNNIAIVTNIKAELSKLKDHDDVRAVSTLLHKEINEISISGQTRELILHILKNITDIHYSTRKSSMIEPQPIGILSGVAFPLQDGQRWEETLATILEKKNLPRDLFNEREATLNLNSDISEHTRWVFNHIYRVAYPKAQALPEARECGISRYVHGIQHVSRVALNVQVFANFYRKYGDEDALQLTDEDVKLLQIAALFHDAARENEGEDLWDHESAVLLYFYLTRVLAVDKNKAKLIAEATANKDPSVSNGWFTIKADAKGGVIWEFKKLSVEEALQKNIYQKIIHDADCLDIIRARPHYDATYLDFYKEIVRPKKNNLALEEIAHLVCEARSIIERHGDSYNRTKPEIKKTYENENARSLTMADINENDHRIIDTLGRNLLSIEELKTIQLVDATSYDKEKGLSEENVRAALRESRVFSRGIASPSAIDKKHEDETLAELEIRKTMRELGMATKSRKVAHKEKNANPLRSVSMLGYGAGVFTNAGFLIIDPDIDAISKISTVDAGTGRGKKAHLVGLEKGETERPSRELVERDLAKLHNKLKLGGESIIFGDRLRHASSHVEILYDVNQYNAIYYSNDPNLYNKDALGAPEATHRFSPLLQAIYLQKQYEIQYEKTKKNYITTFGDDAGLKKFIARFGDNKSLPIFEYSGLHNRLRSVPESELTDENVMAMWVEMCTAYMQKELAKLNGNDIYHMDIDDIKIYAMYRYETNDYARCNGPADSNYSADLREKINAAIDRNRKELITEHEETLRQNINGCKLAILSNESFFNLLRNPSLLEDVDIKDKVRLEIERELPSSDLFLNKSLTHFFEPKTLGYSIEDGVVTSLTTDLNELATKHQVSQIHEDIFFETKAVRIYALSLQLGLKESIEAIQNKAIELVKQAILKIKDGLKSQKFFPCGRVKAEPIKIIHLIKFIDTFNISSDEFKSDIDEIQHQMVQESTNLFLTDQTDISDYSLHIDMMQKLYMLQPADMDHVNDGFQYAKNMVTKYGIESMGHFLEFANVLGKNPRDDLIAWFNSKEPSDTLFGHSNHFDEMMAKVTLLNDDNLDLFQIMIERSRISEDPSEDPEIDFWFYQMVRLQKRAPDQNFSEEQLKIIERKWSQLCNTYIYNLNKINHTGAAFFLFKDLLKFLSKLLNSDLRLSIDQLTQTFNVQFDEFVNSKKLDLAKKFDKSTINLIRDLHEKLPFKTNRADAMQELNGIRLQKQQLIKMRK